MATITPVRSIDLIQQPRLMPAGIQETYMVSGSNMPSEVFVLSVTAGQAAFSRVATVDDLLNVPIGPRLEAITYRTASFNQTFATQALADAFFATLQSSINTLIKSLNKSNAIPATVTVTLTG